MRPSTIQFLMKVMIVGWACQLTATVNAQVETESIDASLVGSLDQTKTNWPKLGCGPTAAVNSFIYLQNQYPSVYGRSLVPGDAAVAANNLGLMMGTNNQTGTFWTNFILGKQAYLTANAPGTTVIDGLYDQFLLGDTIPPGTKLPPNVKPDIDEHSTMPQFLLSQLHDHEDVEILFQGDLNHYVTLTSLTFDFGTNKGTIDYMDPLSGKLVTNVGIERFDSGSTLFLTGQSNVAIELAVAESPVPEPSTIVLGLIGAVGGLAYAWRHS
jgi:hypothetical protein